MKKFALPFLILIFAVSVFAQTNSPKTHEIKGLLKTDSGEVLAGTNLYFSDGINSHTFVTDINGEFTAKIPAGNYEVTVNNLLSKKFKAFITVVDGGTNPENVEFTVKANKTQCGLNESEICPEPVSLPKPAYPPAARAVNATGEVVVFIKLDDAGNVISATVKNGHPLLRTAAKKAAEKSKFDMSDKSAKSEFYLTYVFLSPGNTVEKSSRYKYLYRIEMIGKSLPVEID